MANRKVVIEEVLTERENYSKVILHKPMMLPKKDQKSEKEIDIRDSSRYVNSQWLKIAKNVSLHNFVSQVNFTHTLGQNYTFYL